MTTETIKLRPPRVRNRRTVTPDVAQEETELPPLKHSAEWYEKGLLSYVDKDKQAQSLIEEITGILATLNAKLHTASAGHNLEITFKELPQAGQRFQLDTIKTVWKL